MKATVVLVDPEDQLRVETDARDMRAFERDGRRLLKLPETGPVKAAAEPSPGMFLAYLVWHAMCRDKLTDLGFATWERTRLVEVVPDGEEELPDPTRPEP